MGLQRVGHDWLTELNWYMYILYIGVGNGNPFQYSCLGNLMDRGTWWATVHGVTESDTTEHTQTHIKWICIIYITVYNINIYPIYIHSSTESPLGAKKYMTCPWASKLPVEEPENPPSPSPVHWSCRSPSIYNHSSRIQPITSQSFFPMPGC